MVSLKQRSKRRSIKLSKRGKSKRVMKGVMKGGGPFDDLFMRNPDGTLKMELKTEQQANVIIGLTVAILGGSGVILQGSLVPSLPREALVIIDALGTIVRSIWGLGVEGITNLYSLASGNIITVTAINILKGLIMSLNVLATTQVTIGSVVGLTAVGAAIKRVYGEDIADFANETSQSAINMIETNYNDFLGEHADIQSALSDKFLILLKDLATIILFSLNGVADNVTSTASFVAQLPRVAYNSLVTLILPRNCTLPSPPSPSRRPFPSSGFTPSTPRTPRTPATPPSDCNAAFKTVDDISVLAEQNNELNSLSGDSLTDQQRSIVNEIDAAAQSRYDANLRKFEENMLELENAQGHVDALEADVRRKRSRDNFNDAMASQPEFGSPSMVPPGVKKSKSKEFEFFGGKSRRNKKAKRVRTKKNKKSKSKSKSKTNSKRYRK